MGLSRLKTQIYVLVVSLIVSILGMAIMKLGQGDPPAKVDAPMTTTQKLDALEKVSSQSPGMSKFLKREKAAEEANQQAFDALPK